MTLAKKMVNGVIWNFIEQLLRRGVGIVVTLLLAFFLAPEDFGLIAMISVFLALGSTLMNSGFNQALIRFKDPTQIDFNTAFYSNILLSIVAYLSLYILAPWIADFYEEPRLIFLIRIVSLTIIVSSFSIVHFVILNRYLNFKAQLKVRVPAATLSGGISITLAVLGMGVWALVSQILLSSVLVLFLIWRQKIWRPSVSFSFFSLNKMYSFGFKLFLANILDILFRNAYIIIIAKTFALSVVGWYVFADKIKELVVSQLVKSIQKVTYPALATMQDDNIKLKVSYRKIIAITSFLLFPSIFFLAVLSEPLFEVFIPEKWWPAVSYLQLMLLGSVMYPLHSINLNILKVKGRSDLFLYLEIVKKIVLLLILVVSYQYGVIGILIGQVLNSLIIYIPNSFFSNRLIGYGVKEQVRDFLPYLLLSITIAGGVWLLRNWFMLPPWLELIIYGSTCAILYLLGAYFLKLKAYTYFNVIFLNKLNNGLKFKSLPW